MRRNEMRGDKKCGGKENSKRLARDREKKRGKRPQEKEEPSECNFVSIKVKLERKKVLSSES